MFFHSALFIRYNNEFEKWDKCTLFTLSKYGTRRRISETAIPIRFHYMDPEIPSSLEFSLTKSMVEVLKDD